MQKDELFQVDFFYWYDTVLMKEELLFRGTAEEAADFARMKMAVKSEAGRDPFGLSIHRPVIYNRGYMS